ncbi:MAG: hypothetical protein C4523_11315 [Myxococcales bacterium]|nr:MAG: hypothetical protein C4523_11315 [Myxococcales bacterium]
MRSVLGFLAGILAFTMSALAVDAGLNEAEIAPRESGVQLVRYADEQRPLYNYRWELVREGNRVTVTGRGDNDKKGPERVEWAETSMMEIAPGGLRTLVWTKESSGAEQESWRMKYDWAAHKVVYAYRDRASGKSEEKTLTFGPKAYASDAMYFFLRGFPFEKGEGAKVEGEFVLTEGKVMSGVVIHRGEEQIKTAFGPLDAYKLEFKPGGLLGAFAPRMFIWYTKSMPHLFVRFDGKDDGVMKPRTTNELVHYSPADRIKPVKPN